MRRVVWTVLLVAAAGTACAADEPDAGAGVSERSQPTTTTTTTDSGWRSVPVIGYEQPKHSSTSVDVLLGYCGDAYRVDVEETDESVTIHAETSDPAVPLAPDCATLGTAPLEAPLGAREVVDAVTGEPAPER